MDQRVLRVSTAVQHKVLQHLVLHGPVGVRRQVIQEKHVVGALQTMFGTEVSVLRVSTVVQLKVLQQLVLRGRVRARPDTRGHYVANELIMHVR
jgi:hypothetical protein